MAQDMTGKTRTIAGTKPQNPEEQIRQSAFALYEARGRQDGHDLDDWLRAEKEITEQKTRITAA